MQKVLTAIKESSKAILCLWDKDILSGENNLSTQFYSNVQGQKQPTFAKSTEYQVQLRESITMRQESNVHKTYALV